MPISAVVEESGASCAGKRAGRAKDADGQGTRLAGELQIANVPNKARWSVEIRSHRVWAAVHDGRNLRYSKRRRRSLCGTLVKEMPHDELCKRGVLLLACLQSSTGMALAGHSFRPVVVRGKGAKAFRASGQGLSPITARATCGRNGAQPIRGRTGAATGERGEGTAACRCRRRVAGP